MSVVSGKVLKLISSRVHGHTKYAALGASRRTMLVVAFMLLLSMVVVSVSYLNLNKYHHIVTVNEVKNGAGIIKREIKSLRNVVDLLATSPLVVNFDLKATPHKQQMQLLLYLQNLKHAGGIIDAYVLDKDGKCIAASSESFEGQNYAFRAYFTEAVKNGSGDYFAYGVTSKMVGLYLSQRIEHGVAAGGVVVIKVDPLIILAVADESHMVNDHGGEGQAINKISLTALASPSGVMVSSELEGMWALDIKVMEDPALTESCQFELSVIEELGLSPGIWQNLYENKMVKTSFKGTAYNLFIEEVIPGTLFFFHSFSHGEEHAVVGISLLNRTMMLIGVSFLLVFVSLIIFAFSLDRQRFRLENMGEELSREKRLKDESESRYQVVIENNTLGFWTMAPDTAVIESANKTLCDMLGFSASDLIGMTPTEMVADDDVPVMMTKSMGGEGHYTLTVTMIGSDKKRIPVHIDSRLMTDGDGNPLFRYCFIADLSQKVESLEKIRLLEAVVEQAPSSIVITDIKGSIRYVNPAFSKVTGYSYKEAVGNNPKVLKSDNNDESLYEDMWQVLSTGEVWRGRFYNKAKDGSLYWEEAVIAPVRNDDGVIGNYVAIKNNITEKVGLEEELQQRFAEKELIVQHAGVGIIYTKGDKIIEVNEMAATLLAVPVDKLILEGVRGCFPDLRTGNTVEFEQERVAVNGGKIRLRVTGRAVSSDFSGKGAIWIVQDITAIYKEKQRLERQRREAEEASSAKSMFLANMSHEIRTPMNAIIGMTRLVEETALDDEQKRYIGRISTSSTMLLDILNDILDFSKIEAGQLLLGNRPFLTNQLICTVQSIMTDLAAKKGVVFEISCDADVPDAFVGDMSRLVQVLVNLVGNGIKFTEQGWVKVRISSQEQNPDLEEVVLCFSVEDSGIGIAMDDVQNLFQEFKQVDSSVSRRFGGTGLGLAISRKLVQFMGGDISVASREGIGSTFSFTVIMETCPAKSVFADARAEGGRVAMGTGAASEKNLKILLVEDNEANCELATIVLEKFGHKVFVAENGMKALVMLAVESFDLVLMDVQMPEMDGVTATKVIRAMESEGEMPISLPPQLSARLKNRLVNQHLPVIAMTAHVMASDRQRCFAAGMDDYLTKPFQFEQLQNALLRIVRVAGGDGVATGKREREEGKRLNQGADDTLSMVKQHLAWVYGLEDAQIEQLLASSAQSIGSNLEKAQTCLNNGELEMVASAAHALKGLLLNFGLTIPAAMAAKIETAVENGESESYEQLLAGIRKEVGGLLSVGRSG